MMLSCSFLTATLMAAWPVKNQQEVQAVLIQRGEMIQTMLVSGTVNYRDQQFFTSPFDGKISRIYVKQGQSVNAGDLLFRLDTKNAERALEDIYQRKNVRMAAASGMENEAAVMLLKDNAEYSELEQTLLSSVSLSQIRAASPGEIERIDVREGDYVQQSAVLGALHGDGVQITASVLPVDAAKMELGSAASAADKNIIAPFYLTRIFPVNAEGLQKIVFECEDGGMQDVIHPGETICLEVTVETQTWGCPVPLSALDADGNVWIIANGKARSKPAETDEFSRTHFYVSSEWEDQTVVLYPDLCDLSDGTPVLIK